MRTDIKVSVLEIRDDFPAGAFLRYSHELNPSYLDLANIQIKRLSFHTDKNLTVCWRGKPLDILDSDHGGYEIFSDRIVAVLVDKAPIDILISGIVVDGTPLKGFSVVRATKDVDCLDYERATIAWVKYGELEKIRVDEYAFDGRRLGSSQFARCTILGKGGELPGPEVFAPALAAEVRKLRPHGFKLVQKQTSW